MRNDEPSTAGAITMLVLMAGFIVGWILNVVKLVLVAFAADGGQHGTEILVRLIGIFMAPLGAIAGYF